ncbi:hypothetical protein SCHPADRAFT_908608 [Schizopora paradoxa]|uniref:Uncharacterized protein n=1 Tax=Schizopora paradoxa TaxID=27342 RepID=A0A0H2R9D2_9AGAM|nr:hypothetical protein SCHPADRAFT_908608 [Schizopora paradoxa]
MPCESPTKTHVNSVSFRLGEKEIRKEGNGGAILIRREDAHRSISLIRLLGVPKASAPT